MFELTIKKQGVVTNGPSPFETLALAEEHVAREEANQSYGKTDRWKHEKELSDEEKIEYPITRKIVTRDAVAAKDAVTEEYTSKEAVIDEETGEILEPAVISTRILEPAIEAVEEKSHLEHFIPKKYQVIIEDVTARVEQELLKKQQKEQKRLDRIDALQALEWSTITNFATIKPVCKLMSEIINDILKEQKQD